MDRERLGRLGPFETLIETPGEALDLPEPFARLLPRLVLPPSPGGRPAVVVNFVVSLDGAVRLSHAVPSSRAVALASDHDWFQLGLLRTLAAAIVIGAEPVRADRGRQDGASALRGLTSELEQLRASVGLGPLHHVVLSGSGRLPSEHVVWDGPATVLTTAAGADRLALPASVEVIVDEAAKAERISAATALDLARQRAVAAVARSADASATATRVHPFVLAEPGPGLFAMLVGQGLVDELFLTVSPLLAGTADGRLGLMGGPGYAVSELVGLSRAGDHLFGRWRPRRAGLRPQDVAPTSA